MTPEDFEAQEIEVWTENKAVFDLFSLMGTQWRIGMGGPTGLDYGAVLAVMREMGVTGDAALVMLDDVRVMESQALRTMRD